MRKNNRTRKGLRLFPFILGGYAIFLGLGLITIGLAAIKEGIGIIRALLGLVMTCFGILGVWDGVRDLLVPDKRVEKPPARQFILMDADGKRTSNVTLELLQSQLEAITERGGGASFHLQILPAVPVQEKGELTQISCIYQEKIAVIAFFEHSEEGFQIWRTEPERTEDVLKQVLEDRLDFSGWEKSTIAVRTASPAGRPQQSLRLFGESWENHLQFFSIRDVELAVKGIADGKYRRIELELGAASFYVDLSDENSAIMVLLMQIWSEGKLHTFEKTGTAIQVNFWLIQMLNEGLPTELHGWRNITEQKK